MEKKATAEVVPGREKRKYTPPSLNKIPLRPEEAVLGNCKNDVSPGPRGGACNSVGACSAQGS
jgi:hypothetical protein